jgi:hypothetical protein
MPLNEKQEELCRESRWDFSGLRALFLNCTLKRSPEVSHTEGLMRISMEIMQKNGVAVDLLRPVDHPIAFGVWPDMKEHGWKVDAWPEILEWSAAPSGWARRPPCAPRPSSGCTRPRAC